jgi:hypothetical protein
MLAPCYTKVFAVACDVMMTNGLLILSTLPDFYVLGAVGVTVL